MNPDEARTALRHDLAAVFTAFEDEYGVKPYELADAALGVIPAPETGDSRDDDALRAEGFGTRAYTTRQVRATPTTSTPTAERRRPHDHI
jgi:hypothetical protein